MYVVSIRIPCVMRMGTTPTLDTSAAITLTLAKMDI